MIDRLLFRLMSVRKKINYIRKRGTVLSTHLKNGRRAYLYIVKDFCAEVIFQNDNAEFTAEQVTVFSNVKEFNSYLEREFRSRF